MPINKNLAKNLVKRYGAKKAKAIYYGMENGKNPVFKKGLSKAKQEGHTVAKFPSKSPKRKTVKKK